MRINGRVTLAAASALAIGTAGAAGVHRHHARPQVRCGLPDRPYARGATSMPALAVSQVAVLLRRTDTPLADPAAPPGERVAYFQLNQARLQVAHCSISRVALTVRSDGFWTLSLRADQNPVVLPGPPPPPRDVGGSSAPALQTAHVRRNLFILHVRGYTAFRAPDPDPDSGPGHPLLFELSPEPFLVQRGVPEFLTFRGVDTSVAHDFALIDRVEVELRFQ